MLLMDNDGPSRNQNNNKSLISEWKMFWEGLVGDTESAHDQDPFETGKLESLTLDQIKAITKALSTDKKKINQQLEKISQEIEENTEKLNSLRLVGGAQEETIESLHELTDVGQKMSGQIAKIDARLKAARQREDILRKTDLLKKSAK
ncbi:MAG: hypothetical protein BroJett040_13140 [Oligoflexia bacterium]|nr:MAG: hypothetical protein BroJett040_13140 [Oligoflexia bacterium]